MSKAALIEAVAEAAELTKANAGIAVQAVLDTIRKGVKKEGKFSVPDFGTFSLKKRAARVGRNPQTGEELKIKASKSVSFKPGKALKDSL